MNSVYAFVSLLTAITFLASPTEGIGTQISLVNAALVKPSGSSATVVVELLEMISSGSATIDLSTTDPTFVSFPTSVVLDSTATALNVSVAIPDLASAVSVMLNATLRTSTFAVVWARDHVLLHAAPQRSVVVDGLPGNKTVFHRTRTAKPETESLWTVPVPLNPTLLTRTHGVRNASLVLSWNCTDGDFRIRPDRKQGSVPAGSFVFADGDLTEATIEFGPFASEPMAPTAIECTFAFEPSAALLLSEYSFPPVEAFLPTAEGTGMATTREYWWSPVQHHFNWSISHYRQWVGVPVVAKVEWAPPSGFDAWRHWCSDDVVFEVSNSGVAKGNESFDAFTMTVPVADAAPAAFSISTQFTAHNGGSGSVQLELQNTSCKLFDLDSTSSLSLQNIEPRPVRFGRFTPFFLNSSTGILVVMRAQIDLPDEVDPSLRSDAITIMFNYTGPAGDMDLLSSRSGLPTVTPQPDGRSWLVELRRPIRVINATGHDIAKNRRQYVRATGLRPAVGHKLTCTALGTAKWAFLPCMTEEDELYEVFVPTLLPSELSSPDGDLQATIDGHTGNSTLSGVAWRLQGQRTSITLRFASHLPFLTDDTKHKVSIDSDFVSASLVSTFNGTVGNTTIYETTFELLFINATAGAGASSTAPEFVLLEFASRQERLLFRDPPPLKLFIASRRELQLAASTPVLYGSRDAGEIFGIVMPAGEAYPPDSLEVALSLSESSMLCPEPEYALGSANFTDQMPLVVEVNESWALGQYGLAAGPPASVFVTASAAVAGFSAAGVDVRDTVVIEWRPAGRVALRSSSGMDVFVRGVPKSLVVSVDVPRAPGEPLAIRLSAVHLNGTTADTVSVVPDVVEFSVTSPAQVTVVLQGTTAAAQFAVTAVLDPVLTSSRRFFPYSAPELTLNVTDGYLAQFVRADSACLIAGGSFSATTVVSMTDASPTGKDFAVDVRATPLAAVTGLNTSSVVLGADHPPAAIAFSAAALPAGSVTLTAAGPADMAMFPDVVIVDICEPRRVLAAGVPPNGTVFYGGAPPGLLAMDGFVPVPPNDWTAGGNHTMNFSWDCRGAGGAALNGQRLTPSPVAPAVAGDVRLSFTDRNFSVDFTAAVSPEGPVTCEMIFAAPSAREAEEFSPPDGFDADGQTFLATRQYFVRQRRADYAVVVEPAEQYLGADVSVSVRWADPLARPWSFHCHPFESVNFSVAVTHATMAPVPPVPLQAIIDPSLNASLPVSLAEAFTTATLGDVLIEVSSIPAGCQIFDVGAVTRKVDVVPPQDAIARRLHPTTFVGWPSDLLLDLHSRLPIPMAAGDDPDEIRFELHYGGPAGAVDVSAAGPGTTVTPGGNATVWVVAIPRPEPNGTAALQVTGLAPAPLHAFSCAFAGGAGMAFRRCVDPDGGPAATLVAPAVPSTLAAPDSARLQASIDALGADPAADIAGEAVVYVGERVLVAVRAASRYNVTDIVTAAAVEADGAFVAGSLEDTERNETAAEFVFALQFAGPTSSTGAPGLAATLPDGGTTLVNFTLAQSRALFTEPRPLRFEVRQPIEVREPAGHVPPTVVRVGPDNAVTVRLLPATPPLREPIDVSATSGTPAALAVTPSTVGWSLSAPLAAREVTLTGLAPTATPAALDLESLTPTAAVAGALVSLSVAVLDVGHATVHDVPELMFEGQSRVVRVALDHPAITRGLLAAVSATAGVTLQTPHGPLEWAVGSTDERTFEIFANPLAVPAPLAVNFSVDLNSSEFADWRCADGTAACRRVTVLPRAEVSLAEHIVGRTLLVNDTVVLNVTLVSCAEGSEITATLSPASYPRAFEYSPSVLNWKCPGDPSVLAPVPVFVKAVAVPGGGDPTEGEWDNFVAEISEVHSLLPALEFARALPAQIAVRAPAEIRGELSSRHLFHGRNGTLVVEVPRPPVLGAMTVTVGVHKLVNESGALSCPADDSTSDIDVLDLVDPTPAVHHFPAENVTAPRSGGVALVPSPHQTGAVCVRLHLSGRAAREFFSSWWSPVEVHESRTVLSRPALDRPHYYVSVPVGASLAVPFGVDEGDALEYAVTAVPLNDSSGAVHFSPATVTLTHAIPAANFSFTASEPGVFRLVYTEVVPAPPSYRPVVVADPLTWNTVSVQPQMRLGFQWAPDTPGALDQLPPDAPIPVVDQFVGSTAANARFVEPLVLSGVAAYEVMRVRASCSFAGARVSPEVIEISNTSTGRVGQAFKVYAESAAPASLFASLKLSVADDSTPEFTRETVHAASIRFTPLRRLEPLPPSAVAYVGDRLQLPVMVTGLPPPGQLYDFVMQTNSSAAVLFEPGNISGNISWVPGPSDILGVGGSTSSAAEGERTRSVTLHFTQHGFFKIGFQMVALQPSFDAAAMGPNTMTVDVRPLRYLVVHSAARRLKLFVPTGGGSLAPAPTAHGGELETLELTVGARNAVKLQIALPEGLPADDGAASVEVAVANPPGYLVSSKPRVFFLAPAVAGAPVPPDTLVLEGLFETVDAPEGVTTVVLNVTGSAAYAKRLVIRVRVAPLGGFTVDNPPPAVMHVGRANAVHMAIAPTMPSPTPLLINFTAMCGMALICDPPTATWAPGDASPRTFVLEATLAVHACVVRFAQPADPEQHATTVELEAVVAAVEVLPAPFIEVVARAVDSKWASPQHAHSACHGDGLAPSAGAWQPSALVQFTPDEVRNGTLCFVAYLRHGKFSPTIKAGTDPGLHGITLASPVAAERAADGVAAMLSRILPGGQPAVLVTALYRDFDEAVGLSVTFPRSFAAPLEDAVEFHAHGVGVEGGAAPLGVARPPRVVILPDDVPPERAPSARAAEHIAGFAAFAAGVSSPTFALQAGRIVALGQLLDCPGDSWRLEEEELQWYWALVPIHLARPGADPLDLAGYAAVFISFAIVLASVAVIHGFVVCAVHAWRHVASRDDVREEPRPPVAPGESTRRARLVAPSVTFEPDAKERGPRAEVTQALVFFPNSLWVPLLVFWTPLCIAACRLILYSTNATLRALGAGGAAAVILAGLALLLYIRWGASRSVYTPPGRASRWATAFERGSFADDRNRTTWARRFAAPTNALRGGGPLWWAVLHPLAVAIFAAVVAVMPSTYHGCIGRLAALMLLLLCEAAAILILRPFAAVADTVTAGAAAALQAGAVAAMLAGEAWGRTPAEMWRLARVPMYLAAALLLIRGVAEAVGIAASCLRRLRHRDHDGRSFRRARIEGQRDESIAAFFGADIESGARRLEAAQPAVGDFSLGDLGLSVTPPGAPPLPVLEGGAGLTLPGRQRSTARDWGLEADDVRRDHGSRTAAQSSQLPWDITEYGLGHQRKAERRDGGGRHLEVDISEFGLEAARRPQSERSKLPSHQPLSNDILYGVPGEEWAPEEDAYPEVSGATLHRLRARSHHRSAPQYANDLDFDNLEFGDEDVL